MLKNNKGFSLIELMVVVAIIGILAAIAIPNFQKFQERSRQSEAKGNLSGVFTAEQAFYGQYSSYYGAFDSIGFAPIGGLAYNVGFPALGVVAPLGAPSGTAAGFEACTGVAGIPAFVATYITWSCPGLNAVMSAPPPGAAPAATTFTAGAVAKLNPNSAVANYDYWTLNNGNTLVNTTSGL